MRIKGGPERRFVTPGDFPALGADRARRDAGEIRVAAQQGRDLLAERREAAAADAPRRKLEASRGVPVSELLDGWRATIEAAIAAKDAKRETAGRLAHETESVFGAKPRRAWNTIAAVAAASASACYVRGGGARGWSGAWRGDIMQTPEERKAALRFAKEMYERARGDLRRTKFEVAEEAERIGVTDPADAGPWWTASPASMSWSTANPATNGPSVPRPRGSIWWRRASTSATSAMGHSPR